MFYRLKYLIIITLIPLLTLWSNNNSMEIKKNYMYAMTKYKQKKYRQSLNYFFKILHLDSTFYKQKNVYKYMGKNYYALDQRDSARLYFNYFLKDHPDDIYSLKTLLYLYQNDNKSLQSIQVQKKIMKLEPDNPDHLKNMGKILLKLDSIQTSLQYFYKYLKIKDDPEVNKLVTQLSSQLGNGKISIDILLKSYQQDPDNLDLIKKIIKYHHQTKNIKEEKKFLEIYYHKDPDNITILKKLIKKTDITDEKFLTYNKKAYQIDKYDLTYSINISKYYLTNKQFAKARYYCYNAYKINPKHSANIDLWAKIYLNAATSETGYSYKLVNLIAHNIYLKNNYNKKANTLKAASLIPSKQELFIQNETAITKFLKDYPWISVKWKEVADIIK